jgi:hypothetical protein
MYSPQLTQTYNPVAERAIAHLCANNGIKHMGTTKRKYRKIS